MKIRQAIDSDISAAAAVNNAAWLDSEVNEYLYPYRRRHPKAYHKLYMKDIRELLQDNKAYLLVAETEPCDEMWTGKAEIVGYASWYKDENVDPNTSKPRFKSE